MLVDAVVVGEDDELLVVVAGDVWAAPVDEVVAEEPPHPATTRMSVSAAAARMSFEVTACLLPGQAKVGRRPGSLSAGGGATAGPRALRARA